MTVTRFDPDGNERLTALIGLMLIVLGAVEVATLLLGLQTYLHVHVFVGLALLPVVAAKLGSTGWRFAQYYLRNDAYRLRGAPQVLMRLLAPLLVVFTLLVFGSGVAMALVHGRWLELARRVHGPAAVGWMLALGVHVLVYTPRALRLARGDRLAGGRLRRWTAATAAVAGLALGLATLPAQHVWLRLPPRHAHQQNWDHGDRTN